MKGATMKGATMKWLFSLIVAGAVARTAAAQTVTEVTVTPSSPVTLHHGDSVKIGFVYVVPASAAPARIFVRPMTAGRLSPGYAASGSPPYRAGRGRGAAWFTIQTGQTTVDRLRVQMFDAGNRLVYQSLVPVRLTFVVRPLVVRPDLGAARIVPRDSIMNVELLPSYPTALRPGERVTVLVRYRSSEAGGVRIFVDPMTGGSPTPRYAAGPSPVYGQGTGEAQGWFTIRSVPDSGITVDQVRIQIYSADRRRLLHESRVPVRYEYRASLGAVSEEPERIIRDDGAIELRYPDGTRRIVHPDGTVSYCQSEAVPEERCPTPQYSQIPPITPPDELTGADTVWLSTMNQWLEAVAERLLDQIRAAATTDTSVQRYLRFEAANAATLYERVDLRLRTLEHLHR
jgi:hypothetical protein